MKIIDKYIFKKLIPMFFLLLISSTFMMCLFDYLFNNRTSETNLSLKQILYYYLLYSPFIIKLILPTIAFISTILVVLKLSSRCEIVAYLSIGVRYKRFLKPFLIFGIFLFKILIVCEGWLFPMSKDLRYDFEKKYFGRNFREYDADIHIKCGEDQYLYIQDLDMKNGIGSNVFIDEIKDNKLISRFTAKRMCFDYKTKKWTFYDCSKRFYKGSKDIIEKKEKQDFENINIFPEDLIPNKSLIKKLNIVELNKRLNRLKERGVDYKKLRIEQLSRIQTPLLVVVLIIMAVLLSSKRSRMGNTIQLIIGFIIASIFVFGSILLEGFAAYGGKNIYVCLLGPAVCGIILNFFLYKKAQK